MSFKDLKCFVKAQGATVATGETSEDIGLFRLRINPIIGRAMLMKTDRSLEDWHQSIAHINKTRIAEMARNKVVDGLAIKEIGEKVCGQCVSGKATRVPHPPSTRARATHADLIGKITPTSLGSSQYILLLTDEYSNYKTC